MRVLVVSEDVSERARASSFLRVRPDVELLEAGSALEARSRLADGPVDVLVVDGDLSPQGGYSFLYELSLAYQQDGRAVPPSLLLTDRGEDVWLAGWAAARATLPTPADPFAVARVVGRLADAA